GKGELLNTSANGFHFGIQFKRLFPHFAAPAGLFVPSERHRGVKDVVAVDPDGSRAQFGCELVRLADVTSPDPGGQSINGVIRYRENFLGLFEWSRHSHRAENLFLHDFHLRFRIDQNSWLDEVSRVADFLPAGEGSRAFRDARFEVAAN